MTNLHDVITNLSLDDLREWAGSKILNRGKSYQERVRNLARTRTGGLVATVSGTDDYTTGVWVNEDGLLDSSCTCPYDWGDCKHAVAVILAGLARVKAGEEIPMLEPDDDRILLFDEDEYVDCGRSQDVEAAIRPILKKKKKGELLEMALDLARRYPEVRREILETDQLQSGDIKTLIRSLADEIDEVTSEDAWGNHWSGEGSLPDYSHIQEQLSALLDKGHADEVVKLGNRLWKQGCEQVGQSHDDGETAEEVAECMNIVFEAVATSSMSGSEQLLWFTDIFLEDEYSLSDGGEQFIHDDSYVKEDWLEVVDELRTRLAKAPIPKMDDFSARYHREQVMSWLIVALENSDNPDAVLPLLEQEAHRVQCYGRIVDLLVEKGQVTKAREWCVRGYDRTKNSAVGTAARLQKKLRELARQEEQPELVAAYRAQDFFEGPGLKNYLKLQEVCEEIKRWPAVRTAVLHYLEKGQQADRAGGKKEWPLPAPEINTDRKKRFKPDFPIYGVLIDIAIKEKRLDDVVALYQRQTSKSRWHNANDQGVAEAVAVSHPDIALAIWHQLALDQIALVKPAAYHVAGSYLAKMHEVYRQTKQSTQWRSLIASIRAEHKRKIRLMEALDSLEGKRLID